MNIAFFVAGAALFIVAIILFLVNWDGDRDSMLTGKNNVLGATISMALVGLVLFALPMLFISSATPKISFNFDDFNIKEYYDGQFVEIYLEYNGERIPAPSMAQEKRILKMPACKITVSQRYDFLVGVDNSESVTITGKHCSEIDSVLQLPQINAILSGWNITVDQLAIPTQKGF